MWYSTAAAGINKLSTVVSQICKKASFGGFFSDHSLRATAATWLFDKGSDEQRIMLKTSHKIRAQPFVRIKELAIKNCHT